MNSRQEMLTEGFKQTYLNPASPAPSPWEGAEAWVWVDRSGWSEGEWDKEPDKVLWQEPQSGFHCIIRRAHVTGALCGYVAVPQGHWAHGLGYNETHEKLEQIGVDAPHGGLTYAEPCADVEGDAECHKEICHPSDGGAGGVWWLGFDCAHFGDLSPLTSALVDVFDLGETYRDLDYVKADCEKLARALERHDA